LSPDVAGPQQPKVIWRVNQNSSNGMKASKMLRYAALGLRAEGRLLGFDTGDWSMLLGGFFLAGLLALMV
jgi:hypothetical protein